MRAQDILDDVGRSFRCLIGQSTCRPDLSGGMLPIGQALPLAYASPAGLISAQLGFAECNPNAERGLGAGFIVGSSLALFFDKAGHPAIHEDLGA